MRVSSLIREDFAGKGDKVYFQRRVKFEKATKLSLPQIIEPGSIGVLASGDREIIFELIFLLVGLLRHIRVRSESDCSCASAENEGWNFLVSID